MKKILLGEISSYKAIVVAKYLRSYYSEIDIMAYDYKNAIKHFHTRYCDKIIMVPDPKVDQKNHLASMRRIIKDHEIDLFIPVHSDMYGEYIKNKEIFGIAFGYVGDIEQFDMLHDKKKMDSLLTKLDIKRPRKYDDFDSAIMPFIIKPVNLSSAKGVRYVFTEKDRKKYRTQYSKDLIIQEYVSGVGIGYSVFARNGEILVGFGHKRLAELPVSGGSSVYRDTHFDLRTRELVQIILKATKWSGLAMFEFKLTDEGEIYVIEVNPRIWGSINQGLQNGYNYFEPLLGKSSFKVNNKSQYKTYLSPLVYVAFLNYLVKMDMRPMINFFKNMLRNRADVSIIDDPWGFISLILRKI